MADRLKIAPRHRRILESLLREHLPGVEVWAYGSRVNGRGHDGSDLDLVLRAPDLQELPAGQLLDFEDAIRASNIPFLIEARDWACLPEQFHQEIERDYVVMSDGATSGRERRDTGSGNAERGSTGSTHGAEPVTARFGAQRLRPSDDWIERTIDDLGEVVGGSTPSTKKLGNFDGDVPWLTPRDLSGVHERCIRRGARNLSPKGLAACSAKLLPTGTVLLSTRAPVGYVAIAANPLATNQGFRNIIVRPDFDHHFLYYWLKANTHELERHATGSTFKELSGSALRRICVRLPENRREQRAISHILGTLDDKIELNRRMNAVLETIARGLFRSWFVDFDPVRAKMEGRDTGLPKEIADLFPDRLVDSELGEIPKGWKGSEIGKEVDVVGGGTPSTKEPAYWNDGEYHWATPKDLSKLLSPVLLETERKISDEGLRRISSGLLPPGTVLLSSRAPIGYLAITEVPTAVNQGFIAMICRRQLPGLYVFFWCQENLEHVKDISGGSTFAEISKKAFRPLPVVMPPKKTLEVYHEGFRSVYDRIVSNTRESALLVSLRDTLLVKLVSGKVRVRDAQKLTEAIV